MVEDQAFTGVGIGDVVLLTGRDVQRFREDLPVAGCLVQKVNEVGVLKDVLNLTGSQQILDILGDPGRNPAPFSEPLPDFDGIGGCLFFLE